MNRHMLFHRFHRFLSGHRGADWPHWETEDFPYAFHGRRGGGDDDIFGDQSDPRRGGRHGGGGRLLGHGDLKLLLLALIEHQPRHGYELIRTIEELFAGHYIPSPGVVYPTLTLLEELAYAAIESAEGGRKRYAITAAGHAYLDANRTAVDAMTERIRHGVHVLSRRSLPSPVRKAMHGLKHVLIKRGGAWDKAEAERVAGILERAAAEIAVGERQDGWRARP